MNYLFVFTIIIAIIALIVATINKRNNRHLLGELEHLKASLAEAENDKELLRGEINQITNAKGLSDSTVLAIAGEIARMENNLYRMADMPGHKQLTRALDRMKADLQAEGYTVVPLLGMPYNEGMQMSVVFVLDESLPPGSSIIISVQKPQVNRNGKMIQSASVTVGQNN